MGKTKFRVSNGLALAVFSLLPEGTEIVEAVPFRPRYIESALADNENWRLLPATMQHLSNTVPDLMITVQHPNLPEHDPAPERASGINLQTGRWEWGPILAEAEE